MKTLWIFLLLIGFTYIDATVICQLGGDSHCQECTSNRTCVECETGYYGINCTLVCNQGCLHDGCIKSNGQCYNSSCKSGYYGEFCCPVGFYGSRCDRQCPPRCSNCISDTSCYGCDPGFYGELCTQNCQQACKNGICEQQTGVCKDGCLSQHFGDFCCSAGFFGENCSSKCISNCKVCESNSNCSECLDGFYGEACSMQCTTNCENNKCRQEDGKCLFCPKGYYGDYCLKCPTTCSNCVSDTFCTECIDGYFGEVCSMKCSERCTDNKCRKPDGSCDACKAGFYGEFCCPFRSYGANCSLSCPNHCIQCTSSSVCSACEPGYFGIMCSEPCSDGCKYGECQLETGTCPQCRIDFYGSFCCPFYKTGTNCTVDCPQNCKVCDSQYLCTGCDIGYYGEVCSKTCSRGCKDDLCDIADGICTRGCKSTKYIGDRCCDPDEYGSTCPLNGTCSQNCLQCSPQTGLCEECKSGFFASSCLEKCPGVCKDRKCNISNGRCASGCQEGFYGEQCASSCSRLCRSQICDLKTGSCTYGCISGYHFINETCVKDETYKNGEDQNEQNTSLIYVGVISGVLGLVLAVALAVVVVLCLLNHRRFLVQPSRTDAIETIEDDSTWNTTSTSPSAPHEYDEVPWYNNQSADALSVQTIDSSDPYIQVDGVHSC